MPDIDRRYFEGLMQDRKLSLRSLATRMGMKHSQLSLAFSGARKIQIEEAAKLSSIFGEPLHRIVEAAGVTVRPVSGQRVAVVGAMRGDGTVDVYDDSVVERTTAPCELPDGAVAIQSRTAGTPLEWLDACVFFARGHDGVDPGLLGRLCYAKLRGGPAIISTIKRGYAENTYNCLAPFARESVALEWATPIVITRN